MQRFIVLFLGLSLMASLGGVALATAENDIFAQMKPRLIGPANMSGRIAAIAAVESDPDIIYVGSATGGLWKTVNGGITWAPIFDDQPASSIGAVALWPGNPNIVWVGTGEANPRNSVGVGRGVFKSTDGGKSWQALGLEKTEKISRIHLDPHDPHVAYVAAMGTTWGENPERGVFKTTDGGRTWQKVLYVDEKTGAADLVMAPDNPNKLLAAMWEHRRWPWFFNSGGPGSGLYLTVDGGQNWKKLTDKDGLPKGELGRIGLAFAASNPDVVYALVEAKRSALLRSDDGGYTWKTVNNEPGVAGRPFYYCDIRVNPANEFIVYSLESRLKVSEDGGKSFQSLTSWGQSHSDYHAMWLHPDGQLLMVGNDGGVVISRDRGKQWRFVTNIPVAQFYHVSYDMDLPYNVYGGLQDNGSWRGPSQVLTDRAIWAYHWVRVGGGDGFDTEPDPENSDYGYAMSQAGYLFYFNHKTGYSKNIRPTETDVKHRYNWNAGFAIDPFDPATIYYGSQFLHRSPDKGNTWEIISPDLTTNDPEKQKQAQSGGLTFDVTGAENHTTILCVAPSPVERGVIWVGTDDGNVQLTKDAGKNWILVSDTLVEQGLVPAGTWVPHVEASRFDAATAFVVFDDHRRSNWTTYVFVTRDYGQTWQSLATGDIDGFCHVIEQDTVNPDLLFLGTEFGLFLSFNGGEAWQKWTNGFPTVPVRDLAVHPRENDLIIGTHGRAIWILDNIAPLREYSASLLEKSIHLFPVKDTIQFRTFDASSHMSPGDTEFRGENPPEGAVLQFLLRPEEKKEAAGGERKEAAEGAEAEEPAAEAAPGPPGRRGRDGQTDLKVEILDSAGKVIRKIEDVKTEKGMNRIVWDLREDGLEMPAALSRWGRRRQSGLMVLPGQYTARLTYHKEEVTAPFSVTTDPRFDMDPRILRENYETAKEIQGWMATLFKAYGQIVEAEKMLKSVQENAGSVEKEKKADLLKQGKALGEKLKGLREQVMPDRSEQGITDTGDLLGMQLFRLSGMVSNEFEPLTEPARVKYEQVQKMLTTYLADVNAVMEKDVADFTQTARDAGVSLFKTFEPVKLGE